MAKTTKILLIILVIIIIAGILTVVLINISPGQARDIITETSVRINENNVESELDVAGNDALSRQEQYEKMLEDEDFIEVYNNFQYFHSEVIDAGLIEDNGTLFYMVFTAKDSFEKIDQFYKNKKVQSVWSRTEIFETADKKLEENFLDDGKEISSGNNNDFNFSKYSFISQDKDRFLNVLIKSLSIDSTQIMLVFWDLGS